MKTKLFSLTLGTLLALSNAAFAGNYQCSGQLTFTASIAPDSVTILSDGAHVNQGRPTDRTIIGYNTIRQTVFGGLTLYSPSFGYQETYAGNGLNDGEAILVANAKQIQRGAKILVVDLVSTGESGSLNVNTYTCSEE